MPNFTSPGAAATDALFAFLANRDAQERQRLLDGITIQREQRLAKSAETDDEIRREQNQRERDDRKQQRVDRVVDRATKTMRPGTPLSEEQAATMREHAPGLILFDPGTRMAPVTGAPGIVPPSPEGAIAPVPMQ